VIVAVLKPADRVRAIDLIAEATQGDSLIVCGDPPVQAAAAAVAAARDLPYACMPSGPEDLLARDLGMPLDDPAEALKLPFATAERAIDLGEVNGVPFVNRVAVGVELPSDPPRSGRRRREPARGRPQAVRVASVQPGLPALLVCNNRFELLENGLGLRDWPDAGRLQVVTFEASEDRSFAGLRAAGFQEHVCGRFQLALRSELVVDVDGEPRTLSPPLRFRSVSAAVRARAPSIEAHAARTPAANGDPELESIQTG
jgi:diacylglycerol kinase family enzyme